MEKVNQCDKRKKEGEYGMGGFSTVSDEAGFGGLGNSKLQSTCSAKNIPAPRAGLGWAISNLTRPLRAVHFALASGAEVKKLKIV